MNLKFLVLAAAVAAMFLNAGAEEDISSGIQTYYETEKNLSDVKEKVDALNDDIEKIEQDISPLNDRKDELVEEIQEKNAEIIDIENNIRSTKTDAENLQAKKSEFNVNKGIAYKIGNMAPAFIIGLWISTIILIFVWREE